MLARLQPARAAAALAPDAGRGARCAPRLASDDARMHCGRGAKCTGFARRVAALRWPNLVVHLRHLGVDVAVFADGAALRPCGRQSQGAGLGAGSCLHLRHAADQRHAPPAPARRRCGAGGRRGRGAGLVGRHADRGLPACLQPGLGAARAGAGRGRAADHRRAGPGRSGAMLAQEMERLQLSARRLDLDQSRCCAGTGSRRRPWASGRCCPMSTASAQAIPSPRSKPWVRRCPRRATRARRTRLMRALREV